MNKWVVVGVLVSSFAWAADNQNFPVKPDPKVTNGDYCDKKDRDFAGYRYSERIAYCERNVSYHVKQRIYDEYGVPEKCRDEYTVDHFIPLSMGGSNDPSNLWPEHRFVKATRQNLEQQLYLELANGQITQKRAVDTVVEAKMNPPHVSPSDCHR
jgi:hypothetical protein